MTSSDGSSHFPRRVLLGISGSIAATSTPQSVLTMRCILGLDVRAVLTREASTFVTTRALAAATGHAVLLDETAADDCGVPHVEAIAWADLFLVMPATANVLAKAANGIADNLLTTCILASTCPVVFAPSMNLAMWRKPALQRNLQRLRDDGFGVIPSVPALSVGSGDIAGVGAPAVAPLLDWVAAFLRQRDVPDPSCEPADVRS